jgi:hypothetical protein
MNVNRNNEIRLELERQIAELRAQRDDPGSDAATQRSAREAIRVLQAAQDQLIGDDSAVFVARVNQALAELEEVRTRHNLDAVSALGRSIERLRAAARAT